MNEFKDKKLQLLIKNTDDIEESVVTEVNTFIDEIIFKHKDNINCINTIILDSVAMLSVAKARSNELASQGYVKKMWYGFKGKNQKIRAEIDQNLSLAQYASQQMIQKLAEQNLITFEIITTVNNKLNTMMAEVDKEINTIYETLFDFFKTIRSDIVQLENRIEKLEQNVNLLHWHNTIEYQLQDGIEYSTLPEVEKFLCLAKDFYHLTWGKWTTVDLMLLKSTMSKIGIDVKRKVQYKTFIEYLVINQSVIFNILNGKSMELASNIEPYQASLIKAIEKYALLQGEERFVVNAIASITNEKDTHQIIMSLLHHYLKEHAVFDIDKTVNAFDLMNELLVNMSLFFNAENVEPTFIFREDHDEKIRELNKIIAEQSDEIEEYRYKKLVEERLILRGNLTQSGLIQSGYFNSKNKWVDLVSGNRSEKGYLHYFQWFRKDGDLIAENDILGYIRIGEGSVFVKNCNFKSPVTGKLFILKKSGVVNEDDIMGVIANPQDNLGSIKIWLKSQKD